MPTPKIHYGIQGTGNGHISRARALFPEFQKAGADVTAFFTGRGADNLKNMEPFGDYKTGKGLTFATKSGKISLTQTAFHLHPFKFLEEARNLDLSAYDTVVVDYEPVTARAAQLAKRETIGVGNQYAYLFDIPKVGKHSPAMAAMNHFAPVTIPLGVHWHHFDQPILPPITNPPEPGIVEPDKILVYMNFENVQEIVEHVKPFSQYRFFIYSGQVKEPSDEGNIFLRPLSLNGFRAELATCSRVICNAGFELPTEVLSLGKSLLVKPLEHQLEQEANGVALRRLGYGDSMKKFNEKAIGAWLEKDICAQLNYPNVARAIADWVVNTDHSDTKSLVRNLWQQTSINYRAVPHL